MRKTRVVVAGCGNVANSYLPNLVRSPYVEVVAVCDVRVEAAKILAEKFRVPAYYADVGKMLKQEKVELLVNLTAMLFHEPINRLALEAGVNVWCEKPLAEDVKSAQDLLALAEQKGVGIWGAPNTPISPAFASMSEILHSGEIGRVFSAQGIYGHGGPHSAWFYQKGGGALFDLGVYNVMTLSALLGPVQNVVALSGSGIAERTIGNQQVKVEADDNTAVLMDHGNTVHSFIQTGFVMGKQFDDWTIQVIGTGGAMVMGGYDWRPTGVRVALEGQDWQTRCEDQQGYAWEGGASYIAGCLATGKQPEMHGAHAVHVLEIMTAALKSAETGRKIKVESTFPWELYQHRG